jgi:hypothetical protein
MKKDKILFRLCAVIVVQAFFIVNVQFAFSFNMQTRKSRQISTLSPNLIIDSSAIKTLFTSNSDFNSIPLYMATPAGKTVALFPESKILKFPQRKVENTPIEQVLSRDEAFIFKLQRKMPKSLRGFKNNILIKSFSAASGKGGELLKRSGTAIGLGFSYVIGKSAPLYDSSSQLLGKIRYRARPFLYRYKKAVITCVVLSTISMALLSTDFTLVFNTVSQISWTQVFKTMALTIASIPVIAWFSYLGTRMLRTTSTLSLASYAAPTIAALTMAIMGCSDSSTKQHVESYLDEVNLSNPAGTGGVTIKMDAAEIYVFATAVGAKSTPMIMDRDTGIIKQQNYYTGQWIVYNPGSEFYNSMLRAMLYHVKNALDLEWEKPLNPAQRSFLEDVQQQLRTYLDYYWGGEIPQDMKIAVQYEENHASITSHINVSDGKILLERKVFPFNSNTGISVTTELNAVNGVYSNHAGGETVEVYPDDFDAQLKKIYTGGISNLVYFIEQAQYNTNDPAKKQKLQEVIDYLDFVYIQKKLWDLEQTHEVYDLYAYKQQVIAYMDEDKVKLTNKLFSYLPSGMVLEADLKTRQINGILPGEDGYFEEYSQLYRLGVRTLDTLLNSEINQAQLIAEEIDFVDNMLNTLKEIFFQDIEIGGGYFYAQLTNPASTEEGILKISNWKGLVFDLDKKKNKINAASYPHPRNDYVQGDIGYEAMLKSAIDSLQNRINGSYQPDPDLKIMLSVLKYFYLRYSQDHTVSSLIDALADNEPLVAWYAKDKLIEKGDEAVDPLMDLLTFGDVNQRSYAIDILGELGVQKVILKIRDIAVDLNENIFVRRVAVKNLGILNAYQTRDDLIDLLEDYDSGIRQGAAAVLGEFRDIAATIPLLKLLETEQYSSIGTVARAIAEALGKLEDPRAGSALEELLWHNDPGLVAKAQAALDLIGESFQLDTYSYIVYANYLYETDRGVIFVEDTDFEHIKKALDKRSGKIIVYKQAEHSGQNIWFTDEIDFELNPEDIGYMEALDKIRASLKGFEQYFGLDEVVKNLESYIVKSALVEVKVSGSGWYKEVRMNREYISVFPVAMTAKTTRYYLDKETGIIYYNQYPNSPNTTLETAQYKLYKGTPEYQERLEYMLFHTEEAIVRANQQDIPAQQIAFLEAVKAELESISDQAEENQNAGNEAGFLETLVLSAYVKLSADRTKVDLQTEDGNYVIPMTADNKLWKELKAADGQKITFVAKVIALSSQTQVVNPDELNALYQVKDIRKNSNIFHAASSKATVAEAADLKALYQIKDIRKQGIMFGATRPELIAQSI